MKEEKWNGSLHTAFQLQVFTSNNGTSICWFDSTWSISGGSFSSKMPLLFGGMFERPTEADAEVSST